MKIIQRAVRILNNRWPAPKSFHTRSLCPAAPLGQSQRNGPLPLGWPAAAAELRTGLPVPLFRYSAELEKGGHLRIGLHHAQELRDIRARLKLCGVNPHLLDFNGRVLRRDEE